MKKELAKVNKAIDKELDKLYALKITHQLVPKDLQLDIDKWEFTKHMLGKLDKGGNDEFKRTRTKRA